MDLANELIEKNRLWSQRIQAQDPQFFTRLSHQQTPKYLWIGCSDSRVPANQIVDLDPGEVFVHRNVSNLVLHSDMNCLSTIQFAIDILKVEHIMIVGHYGCGGVLAALKDNRMGLIDNWLRYIGDTMKRHRILIAQTPQEMHHDLLCELNVIEQVINACRTTIVRDAWERGQQLTIHGWCYGLKDGLIYDLGIDVASFNQLEQSYERALANLVK
nr:carbonate dehydratase [Candidatus Nitrosacidococcus tergens]